jgi:hypothetical protein
VIGRFPNLGVNKQILPPALLKENNFLNYLLGDDRTDAPLSLAQTTTPAQP